MADLRKHKEALAQALDVIRDKPGTHTITPEAGVTLTLRVRKGKVWIERGLAETRPTTDDPKPSDFEEAEGS